MALTTQQFQTWLEDPSAIRCMLVEVVVNVAGTETTFYLSNRNYVTRSTETPANTAYLPVLKTGVKFTENLPLDGTGSLSYGDLSIDNSNGERDAWLGYAWQGRSVRIYIGDPKFVRDDFTLIFSGLVDDVGSSDRNTLNLTLRDILQRLNTPVTEQTLGNYYKGNIVATSTYNNANKDQVRPLIFGEVFNITPLLMDPTELEYMVHNGPIERLIEVRDNGVPLTANIGYQANLTTGTFKLLRAPAGTITCSVQGDKNPTYNSSVTSILKHIIKTYTTATLGTIVDADFDTVTYFPNYDQSIGVYITQKENLLGLCQQIAASVGAQLCASRAGKIQLLRVTVPTSGTSITDEDIIQNSFSLVEKPEVRSSYRLGYCKNWTVQDNLLTGIPAEHSSLFATEWQPITSTNETARALYKQNALPEQTDTLLIDNTGGAVLTEAARLVALRSVQRYVYRFTCTIKFLQTTSLASMITLTHRRFGLSAGSSAQVISSEIDWDTGFITLQVLV